jgi:hypothetical protein
MKVDYPHRLLLDYEFVVELASGDVFNSKKKYDVLHWLMYIKASSSTNRGDHNVILEEEFDKLCKNKVMGESELKQIVKPISVPNEFDDISDPVVRNLIVSITTTGGPPWSCLILTSKKQESKYKGNKIYKDLRDVTVQCADEAYQTIKMMMNLYSRERRVL